MKYLDKCLEVLGSGFFWAMLLLINAQILFRTVGIGVPWTEEVNRMLFVYLAFIGAAISVRKGESIIVDTVPSKLHGMPKRALLILICMFNILIAVIFFISSIQMFLLTKDTSFSTLRWMSNGWRYVPLVVGFFVIALSYTLDLWSMLKKKGAS